MKIAFVALGISLALGFLALVLTFNAVVVKAQRLETSAPQYTGWLSPTNIQANPGSWALPELAFEEDGNYAYTYTPGDNRVVSYGGFNFLVPPDAEILGIEVRLKGYTLQPNPSYNPKYLEIAFYSMSTETQTPTMPAEDAVYFF